MRAMILMVLAATAGVAACTVPTADDVHGRGGSGVWWRDTGQYRAMDNAIYDVMKERFGDRVQVSEYPEVEYHRWVVISDEWARGLTRHRYRVEARPQMGEDGVYVPHVEVHEEMYVMGGLPTDKNGAANGWGSTAWMEASRDATLESAVCNAVMGKMRGWEASGKPFPESRRDEVLAANRKS